MLGIVRLVQCTAIHISHTRIHEASCMFHFNNAAYDELNVGDGLFLKGRFAVDFLCTITLLAISGIRLSRQWHTSHILVHRGVFVCVHPSYCVLWAANVKQATHASHARGQRKFCVHKTLQAPYHGLYMSCPGAAMGKGAIARAPCSNLWTLRQRNSWKNQKGVHEHHEHILHWSPVYKTLHVNAHVKAFLQRAYKCVGERGSLLGTKFLPRIAHSRDATTVRYRAFNLKPPHSLEGVAQRHRLHTSMLTSSSEGNAVVTVPLQLCPAASVVYTRLPCTVMVASVGHGAPLPPVTHVLL